MTSIFSLLTRGKPVVADPFGIVAALAERKANRAIHRAMERSQAAHKGWATRRGGVA